MLQMFQTKPERQVEFENLQKFSEHGGRGAGKPTISHPCWFQYNIMIPLRGLQHRSKYKALGVITLFMGHTTQILMDHNLPENELIDQTTHHWIDYILKYPVVLLDCKLVWPKFFSKRQKLEKAFLCDLLFQMKRRYSKLSTE